MWNYLLLNSSKFSYISSEFWYNQKTGALTEYMHILYFLANLLNCNAYQFKELSQLMVYKSSDSNLHKGSINNSFHSLYWNILCKKLSVLQASQRFILIYRHISFHHASNFFLFFNKLKVCSNCAYIKSPGTIFPMAFAYFVTLCYILATPPIFQTFFHYYYICHCDQLSYILLLTMTCLRLR